MRFCENLGVITCLCVLNEQKPVLFVSHAGGDWQMYCDWRNHDFDSPGKELVLTHIEHLLAQDRTIEAVADLPVDMGAEREFVGAPWSRYEDKDDE